MTSTTSSDSASRLVLGPLTTTFTADPVCATPFLNGDGFDGYLCQQCDGTSGSNSIRDDASCWPPVTVTTPSPPLAGWGLYSPGLACPVGYVSACTNALLDNGLPSALSSEDPFSFQHALTAGETAVGCCPTQVIHSQTSS